MLGVHEYVGEDMWVLDPLPVSCGGAGDLVCSGGVEQGKLKGARSQPTIGAMRLCICAAQLVNRSDGVPAYRFRSMDGP